MSAKLDTPGIHASKTGSGRLACIVGANLKKVDRWYEG